MEQSGCVGIFLGIESLEEEELRSVDKRQNRVSKYREAVAKLHEKCRRQPASGFRDNAAFVGILSTQLWLATFTGAGASRARAA